MTAVDMIVSFVFVWCAVMFAAAIAGRFLDARKERARWTRYEVAPLTTAERARIAARTYQQVEP